MIEAIELLLWSWRRVVIHRGAFFMTYEL